MDQDRVPEDFLLRTAGCCQRPPTLLGRHMLHQQVESHGICRSHQLDVPMVSECKEMLRIFE
jgi:hypothetical protein